MNLMMNDSFQSTTNWTKINKRQENLSLIYSVNWRKFVTFINQMFPIHQLLPPILIATSGLSTETSNPIFTDISSNHSNILSRYPWVETELIDDISLGAFNISSLPKLHREEEFRNQHIAKSAMEGGVIQYSLDKTKPTEVIVCRSKLHRTFTLPNSFRSAWQIYLSIHISFHPDRGPGLAMWMERLLFYIQLSYQWAMILNYIIAYYQLHQNDPPEQFYTID